MYIEYFKLNEAPFSLTPDPRYLFMSDRHREGLAHLLYGVQQSCGFVQLTGEVGAGKTTLCRCLIHQLPGDTDVALILNPKLTAIELLATVCDELEISYPPETDSIKVLIDALNQRLLETHEQNRRTLLIIDEAQNLKGEVLEQIRLLTNLETAQKKLLQIILLGQPELLTLLKRRNLRQLSQRITARYHLTPLSRGETHAYIQHRLAVAGRRGPLFTYRALNHVYRLSEGIPRIINIICDRALLGAYARDKRIIDAFVIRKAARETRGQVSISSRLRFALPLTIAIFVMATAAFFLFSPLRPTLKKKHETETVLQEYSHAVKIPVTVPPPVDMPQQNAIMSFADIFESRDDTMIPNPLKTPAHPSVLVDMLYSVPTNDASVFIDLFALWGFTMPVGSPEPRCSQGIIPGYECMRLFGGWAMLRRYDLPAILELRLPNGERRRSVLSSLGDDMATLIIHGRSLPFSITEIAMLWDGSFMLLWKPPVIVRNLSTGAKGESVRWLQRALNRLDGMSESVVSGVFNEETKQRVMDFQIKCSLIPDGIVGNETLVRLTHALEGTEAHSLSGKAGLDQ